jgi:hypothetical protein
MNRIELDANPVATERVVHDLNAEPRMPFDDESFDDAVCCVSVDYLTRPPTVARRTPVLHRGDPLYAVWAERL